MTNAGLTSMDRYEQILANNPDLDLIGALEKSGLEFFDRREQGGCLWIVGKYDARGFLRACGLSAKFHFAPNGGRVTNHRNAWWASVDELPDNSLMNAHRKPQTKKKQPCVTKAIKQPSSQALLNGEQLPEEVKSTSIDKLSDRISSGKINQLKRFGVYTIGELANTPCESITSLRGFGPIMLEKLRAAVAEICPLGTQIEPGAEVPIPFLIDADSLADWQLSLKLDEKLNLTKGQTVRLNEAGYCTVEDLRDVSVDRIIALKGLGSKAVYHIAQCLADRRIATSLIPDISAVVTQEKELFEISKDMHEFLGDRYLPAKQDTVQIRIDSVRHIRNLMTDRDSLFDTPVDEIPDDASLPPELAYLPKNWLPEEGSKHMIAALSHELSLARQADSYSQLLCQCLYDSNKKLQRRSMEVYLRRNGLSGKKETLQEIAESLGLTRERVRQLALKADNKFHPQQSRRLLLFRITVYTASRKLGGSGSVDDLKEAIDKIGLPYDGDCSTLFRFCSEIQLSEDESGFQLVDYPCSTCKPLIDLRSFLADNQECKTHDEAIDCLGCASCPSGMRPSIDFICNVDTLDCADGVLGAKSNPTLKSLLHPSSKRAIIHAILFESERELTCDEIVDAFMDRTGEEVSKNHVASQVTSFEDCMLWGRGAYIHERNAPDPSELIEDIAKQAKETFVRNRVPIIGVGGLYDARENELAEAGVPTRHALYSLLRKLNDKELLLKEYPWVCQAESIGDRTSFAKYFYSILEANNGFITDKHAAEIAERVMAQSFALGGLAEYSQYLINANGGWYDIEAAEFDMDGIAQLAIDISDQMGDDDVVSAKWVFETYRERCYKCGVKSYDILYYLIDMMEDDLPIEATRLPHLVKSPHEHSSVLDVARRFIRSSDHPVQKVELIDEFRIKRGINTSALSTKLLTAAPDIILVGVDTYWSLDRLNVDDAFMAEFEQAVSEGVASARKHAALFYARPECIPSYESLPQLNNGMLWNPEILKTVFQKSGRFNAFGEDCSCIVDLGENPEVISSEQFYVSLLENEFMGWSPFDGFADYCSMYSIKHGLEPEYFDAYSQIKADNISVEFV